MKRKILIFIVLLSVFISGGYFISASINTINLNGYVLFIDAGHGGKDNGAYINEILEDTINLEISKLLVESLVDKGAYVYTTRDDDYDLASDKDLNRKAKDLKKRIELINYINPHLFISIHLNTFSNENVIYNGNTLSNKVSLMFNVYSGTEYITNILKILDNYKIKITFK